jgi:hypothetical protein
MVRIKGENSDYKYDRATATIREVQPSPEQLYLQLFVCPYDHPSPVEANAGADSCCHGTDHLCPQATAASLATGHALVRLDQKTGISLVTDRRNQIVLDQSGKIQLCPSEDGRVEVQGPLIVQTQYRQNKVQLEVSDRGIRLQVGSASVIIDPAGNLDLSPSPTGKVRIHGDLDIQGQIEAQLSDRLQTSIIQSVRQSIFAELGIPQEAMV